MQSKIPLSTLVTLACCCASAASPRPLAKMMKAAHIVEWCAPGSVADTIRVGDVPAPPSPIKREVLISVKATAINVDDIALCQNTAAGGWFFHARTPSAEKPLVGGMEYAGVVLECGPLCKRFKVGDRVCGVQDTSQKKLPGTWAEQTLAPEEHVVPLPAAISFVEAASVGTASFVAGDMFQRAKKKLPATGGRCLVIGASGGLGSVLLQMLRKEQGLFIAAVCSGANAGTVLRRGAQLVVDYTLAPFEEQLAGADKFDVVFDFVGGSETQRSAVPLLRRGGQFITAVGPWKYLGDRQLSLCEWTGWACGLAGRLLGSCLPLARFSYEMPAFLPPLKEEEFNEVVVAGGARAEIALQVPLAEAPLRDALSRVASRHPGGKVLINLDLK